MKKTFFDYDMTGYNEDTQAAFKAAIKTMGFKESFPEKGGGSDIVRQLLAYLTIHQSSIVDNIIADVVLASVYKASSQLYNWYKNNKLENSKANVRPVVNIDVHLELISKIKSVTLFIDKEYSEEEIRDMFAKSELSDMAEGLYDYENNEPYQE